MAKILRNTVDQSRRVSVAYGSFAQHFTTVSRTADGRLPEPRPPLAESGGIPFARFVLGGAPDAALAARLLPPTPSTLLAGDPPRRQQVPEKILGFQEWGVSGTPVHPIIVNGKAVGHWFEDQDARYAYLAGVLPGKVQASPHDQTTEVFETMAAALAQAGMEFHHVVRTWFFLKDLLSWYDEFNRARTAFFHQHKIFDHMVPASTGIGASAPNSPAALVCGAYAVLPKPGRPVSVQAIASPLQCPALDYKSSFSRAAEVETPNYRLLLVSGTASIEPGGKTVFLDDIDRQIALTIEVVDAILASRKMDWADCSRAIAYHKSADYIARFNDYWARTGRPEIPVAHLYSDVCRDDLLFEIEADFLLAK